MALSEAILGIETEVRIGDGGSPENFTLLPEIKSISFGGFTAEQVDTTHMQSPNRYREKRSTLKDSTNVTLESHYLPSSAEQQLVKQALEDLAVVNWEIETPDGTLHEFTGQVIGFTISSIVVDNVIPLNIEISINGEVEITEP
jgi:predicted secreted protein